MRNPGKVLNHQVPYNEKCTQPSSREKGVARRAGSLGALLQLFVALPDTLGCLEGLGHQLVNMCRLRCEVIDK